MSEAIDPKAADAQALTVLDRLGEPEAIIAAETPLPDELTQRRDTRERAASTPAPGQSTPSSVLGVAVFALLVLAPMATSVYLARRAA